jgi:hypothetical protein
MNLRLMLATAFAALTSAGAPIQWTTASGGNGHWYELSTDSALWSAARTASLGRTFMGMSGYLATVTSAGEDSFILANNLEHFVRMDRGIGCSY